MQGTLENLTKDQLLALLDKTPVREILTDYDYKDVKELKYKQLKIKGF